MTMFPWQISLFPKGFFSVAPVTTSVKSLANVHSLFSKPATRSAKFPKRSLPCWSPALYSPGQTRANKNVETVTALVYDFDHATQGPAAISAKIKAKNIAHVVYTTWSHRPSEPRFRVILFIDRPLTAKEYPHAWANGLIAMGYDDGVDRVAKDLSRHYALPAQVEGEEYVSEVFLDGDVLKADALSKGSETAEKPKGKPQQRGKSLDADFQIVLDSGDRVSLSSLVDKGEAKHKCACPFQEDASAGSAFVRVLADGRAFVQCASERHTHEGKQWWLAKKKKLSKTSRTADDREEWLQEVPERLLKYFEDRIAYNAPQGVFYRHSDGAWQISSPIRKEALTDHLIGLMTGKCGKPHAMALIDHILSRQVYGFDCQSTRDQVVKLNDVPMLNLYAFPTLEVRAGPSPRMRDVVSLLCAGDREVMKWLLHWSAALIQHPERRAMVAVLVLSPQQGIGKSLYGRILATIIGEGNSAVVSNKALKDSFNSHYVTKLLVLADEVAVNRGAANTMAEVKAAITDDRVHCSAPYAARTTIINRMSWWLTSNKPDPVLIEKDDRRFTVLSPDKASFEYRKMLRECFDPKTSKFAVSFHEEVQGFAHYLHNMQVDWNLISRPIFTEAKKGLQGISAESLDAFCHEIASKGTSTVLTNYPPGPMYPRLSDVSDGQVVPCETLYGTYREWCERTGRRDIKPEMMFRMVVRDFADTSVVSAYIGGRKIEVYRGLPIGKRKPQGKVVPLTSDN